MKTAVKNKVSLAVLLVFLLTEAVIYGFILAEKAETVLLYASILVAFTAALAFFLLNRSKGRGFLALAMLFTAGADTLLVLLNTAYEWAVGLFLIAQIFHALRIHAGEKRFPAYSLTVRLTVSLGAILILLFMKQLNLLTALGALYVSELLGNMVASFVRGFAERRFFLVSIGFVLFLLCDITVGLNGMGEAWQIRPEVLSVLGGLTWIFYLPSQVLIVAPSAPLARRKDQ